MSSNDKAFAALEAWREANPDSPKKCGVILAKKNVKFGKVYQPHVLVRTPDGHLWSLGVKKQNAGSLAEGQGIIFFADLENKDRAKLSQARVWEVAGERVEASRVFRVQARPQIIYPQEENDHAVEQRPEAPGL